MVSLLDLAPTRKKVTLSEGLDVEVRGLSAKDLAFLLGTYPELKKLLTGKAATLNPQALIEQFPDAMAHVIALGLGVGTSEELVVAGNLAVGFQLLIITAIIEQTLGGDLDGPFVQKLVGLASKIEDASAIGGKAPVTKSSKASKS